MPTAYSILNNVEEGDRIKLTSLSEEELQAYFELNPAQLMQRVDLKNTNKDELYATLIALDHKGLIEDTAAGNMSLQVGLDANLSGNASFNALDYFKKSIRGMEAIPGYSVGSDVYTSFKAGYNTLLVLDEASRLGVDLNHISKTV